jgi:hypothetical protein
MKEETLKQEELEIAGGSIGEGIAAIGAVALGILALIGIFPQILIPIAAIAIGTAFFLEGGTIVRQITKFVSESRNIRSDTFSGGITAELLAGVVGITLGILALLRIVPIILLPVVAVVCGAALIVGGTMTARLNSMALEMLNESERVKKVSHETISAAANIRWLVGLGVITLGVLGLIGIEPLILSTIAFLSVGFVNFLIGTAISGRMINLLAH